MSEVSDYVARIRNAKYGLEVREAIAAGIEKIDGVAEGHKESAKTYMEKAREEANRAEELAEGLNVVAQLLDDINGEVI